MTAGLLLAGCGSGSTRTFTIPSSAMEPTLHCGKPAVGCEGSADDQVVVQTGNADLARGDIVVFKTPPLAAVKCGAGGTFVKRIIGLPGDKLQVRLIRGNGYVFVNGLQLNEPYIQASRRTPASRYGPTKIAVGSYFMMGDNRANSCDSRFWGTVPTANIIGKVTKIIRAK